MIYKDMSMEEELHSGLGTLGVEVSHKPKWVSIGGHPVLYKNRDPGKLPDFGFIEIQRCEYCERTREVTNKDMSMENPSWVDGQKSILEQRSMSMEEEKDTQGYIQTPACDCDNHSGCSLHDEEKDTSWEVEKQLFEMVYRWGEVGVVVDEKCNAFQEKLEEVIKERELNRYKNSKAPCFSCWHHHMNNTPHDCDCGAHI